MWAPKWKGGRIRDYVGLRVENMDDQNQRDIDTNGEGKSGAGFLKIKVLLENLNDLLLVETISSRGAVFDGP